MYAGELEKAIEEMEAKLKCVRTEISRLELGLAPFQQDGPQPGSKRSNSRISGRSTGNSGPSKSKFFAEDYPIAGSRQVVTPQEAKELATKSKDKIKEAMKKRLSKEEVQRLASEFKRPKKSERLPDSARVIMKRWFTANFAWPYPSEQTKKELANEAKINLSQVNYWFINNRKRHWSQLFKTSQGELAVPTSQQDSEQILIDLYGSIESAKEHISELE